MPSKTNADGEWQRQTVRCAVKPGALVVLKRSILFGFLIKPRSIHSAAIIDISNSGIRAQYTSTTIWSSDFDKMSIVTTDKKIAIDNIPCKIISDSMVARLPNGKYVRKCGIKYGKLSGYHKLQLSYFIEEYAIDPRSSKAWHVEIA
jgi:hypothetical protein